MNNYDLYLSFSNEDCEIIKKSTQFEDSKCDAYIKYLILHLIDNNSSSFSRLLGIYRLSRYLSSFKELKKYRINCINDAGELFINNTKHSDNEYFKIILLHDNKKVIGIETVARGTYSTCIVDPRRIFTSAVTRNADSIILGHNHPSGNLIPSNSDITHTKNLIEAGKLFNIEILDHIIFNRLQYISLKEKGYID